MKKTLLLSAVSVLLGSCSSQFPKRNALGGAKDKHGCLASAGQTWSELRQTCIQVFEEGIRLNPMQVEGQNAVISAFVLLDKQQSKAELFLPSGDKSIILEKSKENLYQSGQYQYNSQTGVLWIDGKARYQSVD